MEKFGRFFSEKASCDRIQTACPTNCVVGHAYFPAAVGSLATVKRRKLAWFVHVTRHDSLYKTTLQGTLEGGRRRGRQRICWMDNVRVDIPAYARKAHDDLLQKRLEEEDLS